MARTILTTVGTSSLTNAKRMLGVTAVDGPQLARFLLDTPAKAASAETNSLSHLLQPDDAVVFLHSDTLEGQTCGEALKRHYDKQNFRASAQRIANLSYKESQFKMRGLRCLVATLLEQIRSARRDGRDVLINATGGFKAETAYATLVGLLFGVPVFYIHEVFQEVIEMPRTPLGWDFSLIALHHDFFAWVSEELRSTEHVETRLRGLPPDVHLLLEEEEGYTLLSATGEAIYEAYRERLLHNQGVRVLFSSRARDFYAHAEPTTRRLMDDIVARLRVPEIRINNSHRVDNCDALVFPSGRYAGRLFYSEEPDGGLKVYELSLHDDRYDKMIARGVNRSAYADFAEYAPA